MDFTTIIGIMLGVCCILLGQTLEGGHVSSIVQLARKSRREGLLVLETEATTLKDHFFRRAVTALVDGSDAATIRKLLDNVITQERLYQEPGPKIWESAGGFAPTIGILLVSDGSPDGRRINRRVDIVVLRARLSGSKSVRKNE